MRRRVIQRWLLVGLLVCSGVPLIADSAAQSSPTSYEIVRIGVDQGLSHRLVYDVLEDHQGYIWVATREGLNRFDGHRFVVYQHEPGDSLSIPDSKVMSLFEGRDGTLWIGTNNAGLARFDRSTETFQRIPSQSGTDSEPLIESIMGMAESPDGTLWVSTQGLRLFRLEPGQTILKPTPVTRGGTSMAIASQKVTVSGDGHAVSFCRDVAIVGGILATVDAHTLECRELSRLDDVNLIGALETTRDGSLVLGGHVIAPNYGERVRVVRWNETTRWTATISSPILLDLMVDDLDRTWVATYSGVYVLDAEGRLETHFVSSLADVKSLSDDRVTSLILARDGSIWVGTHDGLSVLRRSAGSFRAIRFSPTDESTISDPRVNAIAEGRDGTLWVGTSRGLNRRPKGSNRFERLLQPDVAGVPPGAQTRIWSLLELQPGTVWIGTGTGGLQSFQTDQGVFEHVDEPARLTAMAFGTDPGLPDRSPVPFLGRDKDGNVWLSNHGTIQRRGADGHLGIVVQKTGPLPSQNFANVVFQDGDGRYWAGNDLGLHELLPGTGELRPVGETGQAGRGLSASVVWTIAESALAPGALWVGTIGGGLNRYDKETGLFTWYTSSDGLPSNSVYGILVDDKGLLWMSTTNGLAWFDPRSGSFVRFTRHDGLHDDEFDLMAYHRGETSGTMWFGGPTGLTEFHPDSVTVEPTDFRVNISGISVLDNLQKGIVSDGDTLRLTHRQNLVSFRFSAPDLLHPEDATYRFRLNGYDADWRSAGAVSSQATYTGLPPDRYLFEVQAGRPGGGFSEVSTHLWVVIRPAFWQTWWFRGFAFAIVLGLFGWAVTAFQRRRSRQAIDEARREIELKRLLAEREDRERSRIAREIHDGPIQTLYSVNHRLEEATPVALEASRRDVQDLASELRSLCERLRPVLVAHLGLEAALQTRVRGLTDRIPEIEASVQFDPGCAHLDEATAHAVYRVAQEALSNVAAHAAATHVEIQLERVGDSVHLSVADNGRGLATPIDWLGLAMGRHYGLVGIKERAEMHGGAFSIESAPGRGTRIRVELPLAAAAQAD